MPCLVDVSHFATSWEKEDSVRKRIREKGCLILSSDGATEAPKILQKEAAFNMPILEPLLVSMAAAPRDRFGNFSLFSIPALEKQKLICIGVSCKDFFACVFKFSYTMFFSKESYHNI